MKVSKLSVSTKGTCNALCHMFHKAEHRKCANTADGSQSGCVHNKYLISQHCFIITYRLDLLSLSLQNQQNQFTLVKHINSLASAWFW